MFKYTIYIPLYISDDNGNPVVHARHIAESIVHEVVQECGGATVVEGNGWWVDGGKFIKDPVLVCTTYHENFNYKRLAASIQLQLNQKSVLIVRESCEAMFL